MSRTERITGYCSRNFKWLYLIRTETQGEEFLLFITSNTVFVPEKDLERIKKYLSKELPFKELVRSKNHVEKDQVDPFELTCFWEVWEEDSSPLSEELPNEFVFSWGRKC